MINVSNDFKERMEGNRDFRNYAEITFSDGSKMTLDASNFIASNNSIVDGAGTSDFPLGVAVSKVAQIELINDDEQFKDKNFLGAKIRMYTDFQLDEIDPWVGRNLCKDTDFSRNGVIDKWTGYNADIEIKNGYMKVSHLENSPNNGYGSYQSERSINFKSGYEYTVSFEAYADSPCVLNYCYIMSPQGNIPIYNYPSLTEKPEKRSFKITPSVDRIGSIMLGIVYSGETNESFYFKNFKIEEGNISTDYSIAPEDIRIERLEKGTYTVITPETYGETVIITAYDDMYKADKDYTTGLTFPKTAGAVLRDICDTCDISLGSTSFLHDDFIIESKPTGKFREVIGYIAMISCGNARFDVQNRLQILSYNFKWDYENNYPTNPNLLPNSSGNLGNTSSWSGAILLPNGGYNGSNCLILRRESGNTSSRAFLFCQLKNQLQNKGSKKVTFSGYYFVSSSIQLTSNRYNNIFIRFVYSSGDSTDYIAAEIDQNTETDKWIRFQKTFEVPNKEFSAATFIVALNEYGEIRVSQLKLEESSVATPWIPAQGEGGTPYLLLKEFNFPKIEYNDTVISGFKALIKGETSEDDVEILQGTDNYCITVENPLIAGHEQTVLSWLLERIGNVPFRPFSGDAISNPLVEFMDLAKVQDRRENQYNTFVTDVNFLMPGYTTLKNSTPSMSRSSIVYTSNSARVEQRARQLVKIEKTARELAVKLLSEALENASGMYSTDQVQPDGSTIRYLHDKPTLAESKNIIKITSEAIGFSNDGKTYPYGITLNGETITRLLYAEGINADYINAGAITVKDDNSNVIFSVDIDTKQVIISGDNVQIGGKTLTEKFDEVNPLSIILSNEYQGVPTDSAGNYSGTLNVQTVVQTYYGHQNVSASCTYSQQTSSGVTGKWDGTTRTYTITALTADTGWVDITASYMNLFTVTKRFNISKVRDGKVGATGAQGVAGRTYFIEVSANVLKRGQNNAVTPATITARAYYRDGSSATRTAYAGRWIVATSTNGTSFTTVATSTVNESSRSYSVSNLSSSITSVRFTLYAAGGTTVSLDMQTIPIVIDVANLTQEQIFNILTNNGTIKGIYKDGDNLYVNADYIKSGKFSAQETAFINPSLENVETVLKFASGQKTPTSQQIALYDFNKNGKIDVEDATLAAQLESGKITIDDIVSSYGYSPQKNIITVNIDPTDPEKNIYISVSGTAFEHSIESSYFGVNGAKIRRLISDSVYAKTIYAPQIDSDSDLNIGNNVRNKEHDTKIYGDTITCNGGLGGLKCNSNWQITSDERLKDDISTMSDSLVEVWKEIEPKSFVWGKKSDIYNPNNSKLQFGIMAQDVIRAFNKFGIDITKYGILSDYEIEGESKKYYSLAYDHYFMLTANALRSAMKRIEVLENQVNILENKIIQNKENAK